jgi:Ca2+/Na+ antiporter
MPAEKSACRDLNMKLHPFTVAMTLAFCAAAVVFVVLRLSLPVMLAVLFVLIVVSLLGQKKWGEYRPPPSPAQPTRPAIAATRLGVVLTVVGLVSLTLNAAFVVPSITEIQVEAGVAILGVIAFWAGHLLSYSIPFTRVVAYSFSRHRPAGEV